MTSLTIFVDGRQYVSAKELHLALKMLLNLPEHYGCNADALYDCLSERKHPVNLVVLNDGEGEVAVALAKVKRVVADCGGDVK
ncbi:MAG: barstar family protein [Clostridia bacterium]|nr:barstar family protein [Clostridia bacterium]